MLEVGSMIHMKKDMMGWHSRVAAENDLFSCLVKVLHKENWKK